MKATIDTSCRFDFRAYTFQNEVSVLPLNERAMDYLQQITGRADVGFWAIVVPFALLTAARAAGFRIC